MLTRGFESSVEPRLHFGLGKSKSVDSVLIVWPNQAMQLFKNVKANQQLTIDQRNVTGQFDYKQFFPSPKPVLQEITNTIHTNWKHREDDFVDFNQQPLIPHMLSAEGGYANIEEVAARLWNLDPYSTTAQHYVGSFDSSDGVIALEDALEELTS